MFCRLKKEKGQVAIWVALMITVLLGFGAFTIDLGSLYEERRQLQTIADSAVLAAAEELVRNPLDEAYAFSVATSYAKANPSNNPSEQSLTFSPTLSQNKVSAEVKEKVNPKSKGLFLAPILGRTEAQISARATAIWGPPEAAADLVPFTVYINDLPPEDSPLPGPLQTIYPRKEGSPPGGFGVIDFDQKENSNFKFEQWIKYGYEKLVNPGWIDQGTGLRATMEDAVGYRMVTDSTILLPVYDTYRATGSNGEYHIIGFTAFEIYGVNFRGIDKRLEGRFVSRAIPGPVNPNNQFFGVTAITLVE